MSTAITVLVMKQSCYTVYSCPSEGVSSLHSVLSVLTDARSTVTKRFAQQDAQQSKPTMISAAQGKLFLDRQPIEFTELGIAH